MSFEQGAWPLPKLATYEIEAKLSETLGVLNVLADVKSLDGVYNSTRKTMDDLLRDSMDLLVGAAKLNFEDGALHPDAGPLSYGLIVGSRFGRHMLQGLALEVFNLDMTRNFVTMAENYHLERSKVSLEDSAKYGGEGFIDKVQSRLWPQLANYASGDSPEAERCNMLYRHTLGYMGAAALHAVAREKMVLHNVARRVPEAKVALEEDEAYLQYMTGDFLWQSGCSTDSEEHVPVFHLVQLFESADTPDTP